MPSRANSKNLCVSLALSDQRKREREVQRLAGEASVHSDTPHADLSGQMDALDVTAKTKKLTFLQNS